jgi:hypothetical protein
MKEIMKMNWETFEGQQYIRRGRKEPRVTFCKGTFYLNRSAYEAMDCLAAVEMLFEPRRRAIGLKPIAPGKRNAFAIKRHDKRGSHHRISAAAFCKQYHLRFDRTVLFDQADLNNDGVMVLDLEKTVATGRGAR